MCTPRKQWAACKKGETLECKLHAERVKGLVGSQSVLVAAAAVLYIGLLSLKQSDQARVAVTAVGAIGITTALMSLVIILLGCRVLRQWHTQATKLIEEYGEKDLKGCYLMSRGSMTDWIHTLTFEVYSVMLPLTFVTSWAMAIGWLYGVIG